MARRSCWVLAMAAFVVLVLGPLSTELQAQSDDAIEALHRVRPGGYLSILKLSLIAGVFLMWVWITDWINRDAMQFGEETGMAPELWNPILVISFLIAFMIVISVPIFWAGFPVYVAAAGLPPMLYLLLRRARFKQDPSLARMVNQRKGKTGTPAAENLPQDEGAEITFSPAGADKHEQQSHLIRARQTGGFTMLKDLLFDAQFKRANQMMIDITRDSATARIHVDGTWHGLAPMDRQSGDAVMASLKYLAAMKPGERRARQQGSLGLKSEIGKQQLEVTSQGVPTGERAIIRYLGATQEAVPLDQLGMFPEMHAIVKESLDHAGITIISSPPGHGFTSTWRGAQMSTDRLTRDCVGFKTPDENETDVENIMPKFYDPANGKPQFESLRVMLLTQPDMLVVPKVEDSQTMDLLVNQANTQQRSVLLRTPARSAAEALLRVYSQAGDREPFLNAVKVITCQRLVRRLCPTCRVEVRVKPELIQKLGGDPRKQGTLYQPYQLPPPEQRVDEQGKPIEIPPCETCGGISYIGRIAIFEMLAMNDALRGVVRKTPQAAALEAAAVKAGKKTLTAQAYQLVLLGVTSLAEVQRVLSSKT